MLTRRHMLALGAALAVAPRRTWAAAPDVGSRKFLFVFARGGWDPTFVFAPDTDPTYVDGDTAGVAAEIGGVRFVDAASRPNVRSYFERYGDQSCVINGLEVRSLTHERCRRLVLCGDGEGEADDWAATLAGRAEGYALPHLVLTGPAYTAAYGASVVRLGANNQLAELLSGDFATRAGLRTVSSGGSARAEAFARARAEAWAAGQAPGQAAAWGADLLASYDRLAVCRDIASEIAVETLGSEVLIPVPERARAAIRCFEEGYARCAMIEHLGLFDRSWDTHSDLGQQETNYDLLFGDLTTILDELAATPSRTATNLLAETTVVVFSEMGRTPKINGANGKDHWTFTSAMLVGAGVRGGQVIGGYERGMAGRPVDLTTGALSDTGTALAPEHLGATLYAIAGLDPAELVGADPIAAAVEGM